MDNGGSSDLFAVLRIYKNTLTVNDYNSLLYYKEVISEKMNQIG